MKLELAGFLMMAVLVQIPSSGYTHTLSFSLKDISLKEVFSSIKSQSGVVFFMMLLY